MKSSTLNPTLLLYSGNMTVEDNDSLREDPDNYTKHS